MSNEEKRRTAHEAAAVNRYPQQLVVVEQLEAASPGSRELLNAYQNLGRMQVWLQEYDSALTTMGKSLAIALQLENGAESITSGKIHCEMAKIFMKQQRYPDMEGQLKLSKAAFLQANDPPTEELTRYALHVVQGLRILYHTTGQTAEMEAAAQEEKQLIDALVSLGKKNKPHN